MAPASAGSGLRRRQSRLVAAVEGRALGAGFELLLWCDLIIAGSTARFRLPEVRRGVVAGGGGAMLLLRRIPAAVALQSADWTREQ
jgi:enoyl-CoA hydratase